MYQIIVCNVQEKCERFLQTPFCDICKRNKNERIDHFKEFEENSQTITVTSTPDSTTVTL